VLVFNITRINGINIEGNVLEQTGGMISTFTGTCRAVLQDQMNLMTFEFVWGSANILLAGGASAGNVNRFAGRFIATAHTALEGEKAVKPSAVPPDPGDTGTGNGTQT
jgi:hypothetical protein